MSRDVMPVSGMLVDDAIRQAGIWWQRIGRQRVGDSLTVKFSDDPNDETHHESGILRGAAWSALSNEEKYKVTKAWHHEYFVTPYIEKNQNPIAVAISELVN